MKRRVVYIRECAFCGKEFKTTSDKKKFCSSECRDKGRVAVNKNSSLCWECKKATGGSDCSWANEFIPVEGWDAKQTTIVICSTRGYEKNDISYIVRKCPLFERG